MSENTTSTLYDSAVRGRREFRAAYREKLRENRRPLALACGDSAQEEAQRRASEIAAVMSAYHSEKRRHS